MRPTTLSLNAHRIGLGACAALLLFAASACGGSDGSDGSGGSDGSDAGNAGSEGDGAVTTVEGDQPQSSFELTLDDGSTFSGNVQCSLEPDAEAMIEYNVRGPGELFTFNLVQWMEGNEIGASQEVEMVDTESFEPLYRSVGSTGLTLERNDNVITGSGDFYEGENLNGPYTPGQVTVTC